MIEKKKIDLTKGKEVLTRLNEVPEPVISARQFMVQYFDAIQKSGKSLKALHHFLLSNGVDVGSYKYFREIYNRVKRKRENNSAEQASAKQYVSNAQGSIKKIPEPEKTVAENENKTPVKIDPNTRAGAFNTW